MTHPLRMLLTACLAGLVLSGCGAAPTALRPHALAAGPFGARGEAEKKLDKKLFAELEVAIKPGTRKGEIELHARKTGIRAVVGVKKNKLDDVTINRKDLVKNGKVVVSEGRSWIGESEAADASAKEKTIVKALGLLADAIEAAEVEKRDAEDVAAVVKALGAFVKK